MGSLADLLAPELVGFVLTLGLSLLIGFEREENQPEDEPETHFGGVRTFPLIGIGGFMLVMVFPESTLPFAVGLLVLGALLAVSYWSDVQKDDIGLTTEIAALLTFTLGAAAARGHYWVAIASGVVAVILLQEKKRLEGLATSLPPRELRILLRFLMLTAVILPVVPNHEFTIFGLNPFKVWLVVVAVSGVSYLSYLMQLWLGEDRGLLLSGLLGGAYSSTVTTVVLARQSRKRSACAVGYAGAITAATGMMYIRLWILVMLFAPPIAHRLTAVFWPLGLLAIVLGSLMARRVGGDEVCDAPQEAGESRNPLEMTSAFTFAGLFLVVLVLTRFVGERFGGVGILVMAAIMGAADVDPFILGLTQTAGQGIDLSTAAIAVVIAAATNNLMKGVYAAVFGNRRTGRLSFAVLAALGGASVALFLAL